MDGESVTLYTGATEIWTDDDLMWTFAAQMNFIARISKEDHVFLISDGVDKRFKGRLQLENQTGSLTITNTRITDTGLYHLKIIGKKSSTKTFNVTIYACLPIPVITSNSSQCSSSSKCVLVCSVVNVTQATLSWYKGNSLLSSISVSDLNSSLSLHLEVEYQENNIYSCVINNPIRNQTKQLNITEVCQSCSDLSPRSLIYAAAAVAAAAAGSLLTVAAVGVFYIYRKHRKTPEEGQNGEEIKYADPKLYKGNAQKMRVEDEVVYAEVTMKRCSNSVSLFSH
ncbi:SLAM family member 5-like [Xyrauchen texanus]|uniref:SLAM family member 5-like n=1 Tax=Xyrauchen texanus TaxID=154827 RepID=UPI0022424AF5|nr:SLAM family member 5-like [Xyrauchen texanus]